MGVSMNGDTPKWRVFSQGKSFYLQMDDDFCWVPPMTKRKPYSIKKKIRSDDFTDSR